MCRAHVDRGTNLQYADGSRRWPSAPPARSHVHGWHGRCFRGPPPHKLAPAISWCRDKQERGVCELEDRINRVAQSMLSATVAGTVPGSSSPPLVGETIPSAGASLMRVLSPLPGGRLSEMKDVLRPFVLPPKPAYTEAGSSSIYPPSCTGSSPKSSRALAARLCSAISSEIGDMMSFSLPNPGLGRLGYALQPPPPLNS
mmetsp:Transcript_2302/g.5601  ORF Transcript_2302/g.5601 Transcript_2302/m.5601 type:complete len:200 (-) Transcript_2302:1633-2232(-)